MAFAFSSLFSSSLLPQQQQQQQQQQRCQTIDVNNYFDRYYHTRSIILAQHPPYHCCLTSMSLLSLSTPSYLSSLLSNYYNQYLRPLALRKQCHHNDCDQKKHKHQQQEQQQQQQTGRNAFLYIIHYFVSKMWKNDTSMLMETTSNATNQRRRTICNTIFYTNIIIYCFQVLDFVHLIKTKLPEFSYGFLIMFDIFLDFPKLGPLTLGMAGHTQYSTIQPHRLITSGFVHLDSFHLISNMEALLSFPLWLEDGLNPLLYLTTYLLSIVGGNVLSNIVSVRHPHYGVGASGGIFGLYGLMYICLLRMGRKNVASCILKKRCISLLYGIVSTENIGNAAHLGGFITGIFMGLVCGPFYERSNQKCKDSLELDKYTRDYREVMGCDKKPTDGYLSVESLWICIIYYYYYK